MVSQQDVRYCILTSYICSNSYFWKEGRDVPQAVQPCIVQWPNHQTHGFNNFWIVWFCQKDWVFNNTLSDQKQVVQSCYCSKSASDSISSCHVNWFFCCVHWERTLKYFEWVRVLLHQIYITKFTIHIYPSQSYMRSSTFVSSPLFVSILPVIPRSCLFLFPIVDLFFVTIRVLFICLSLFFLTLS